jgi:hypothetical protein
MKEKAAAVGERIRGVSSIVLLNKVCGNSTHLDIQEDGVNNAIRAIYTYMDRAANRSAAQ